MQKVRSWHKNKKKDLNSIKAIRARHELGKSSNSPLSRLSDILQGSYLLQARPAIPDVIKYSGVVQFSKRSGGQRLPQNSVSQLYEHLLLDRFDSLAAFREET